MWVGEDKRAEAKGREKVKDEEEEEGEEEEEEESVQEEEEEKKEEEEREEGEEVEGVVEEQEMKYEEEEEEEDGDEEEEGGAKEGEEQEEEEEEKEEEEHMEEYFTNDWEGFPVQFKEEGGAGGRGEEVVREASEVDGEERRKGAPVGNMVRTLRPESLEVPLVAVEGGLAQEGGRWEEDEEEEEREEEEEKEEGEVEGAKKGQSDENGRNEVLEKVALGGARGGEEGGIRERSKLEEAKGQGRMGEELQEEGKGGGKRGVPTASEGAWSPTPVLGWPAQPGAGESLREGEAAPVFCGVIPMPVYWSPMHGYYLCPGRGTRLPPMPVPSPREWRRLRRQESRAGRKEGGDTGKGAVALGSGKGKGTGGRGGGEEGRGRPLGGRRGGREGGGERGGAGVVQEGGLRLSARFFMPAGEMEEEEEEKDGGGGQEGVRIQFGAFEEEMEGGWTGKEGGAPGVHEGAVGADEETSGREDQRQEMSELGLPLKGEGEEGKKAEDGASFGLQEGGREGGREKGKEEGNTLAADRGEDRSGRKEEMDSVGAATAAAMDNKKASMPEEEEGKRLGRTILDMLRRPSAHASLGASVASSSCTLQPPLLPSGSGEAGREDKGAGGVRWETRSLPEIEEQARSRWAAVALALEEGSMLLEDGSRVPVIRLPLGLGGSSTPCPSPPIACRSAPSIGLVDAGEVFTTSSSEEEGREGGWMERVQRGRHGGTSFGRDRQDGWRGGRGGRKRGGRGSKGGRWKEEGKGQSEEGRGRDRQGHGTQSMACRA
jgi:hypothetical protein